MKNLDYIIRKTSADMKLPEDQVRKVLSEYWHEGYRCISKLEDTTVAFKHIGVFTVSKFKLNNFIRKTISLLRGILKSEKMTDDRKQHYVDKTYDYLRKALKQRNILATYYTKIKNERTK